MKKILIFSSTTYSINHFLGDYITKLSESSTVYVATDLSREELKVSNDVRGLSISCRRKPNVLLDLIALVEFLFILIRINPDIVITMSPKAGLIASIAG